MKELLTKLTALRRRTERIRTALDKLSGEPIINADNIEQACEKLREAERLIIQEEWKVEDE